MRKSNLLIVACSLTAIAALPQAASAQTNRTLTGAAIGAGSGAIIAGPPGAVVGGVVGAIVGGPSIRGGRSYKKCWYDSGGIQHCRWVR
ncbi:MAG: hypothetical protein ACXWK2_05565 [Rhizomicrobium sp.]